MSTADNWTRRGFLAAATAAALAPRARGFTPLNTIHMGIIGLGGRGRQMLPVFLGQPGVRFVGVCDVVMNRRVWGKAQVDAHNGDDACKMHRDWREMLARPDIDALYIATGDRWHARLAIAAMRAGKDVYCEKPIALSIAEGEAVMRASELYQRIYQGGVQRRNVGNFVRALDIARSGRIGRLKTLHAGMAAMGRSAKNHYLPEQPLPKKEEIDWDMWTGPAPMRAFNSEYVLKGRWHSEYDYHGDLSEWGSHTIDLCQLALGRELTAPVRYVPVGPKEVRAYYKDGVELVLRQEGFKNSCAVRFEGEEGWVEADDSGAVYVSDNRLLDGHAIKHESWQRPVAHPAEFIACVRSRLRPSAPADALHFSHVACHAATVAYHMNRELVFDLATCTFPGQPEANKRLIRSNRAPWLLA